MISFDKQMINTQNDHRMERKKKKKDMLVRGIPIELKDAFDAKCKRIGINKNFVIMQGMRRFMSEDVEFDLRIHKEDPRADEEVQER